MDLSVIIVNYNVKYFLEQCINSLEKALGNIPATEIIIVDNNSSDGSKEYLDSKFNHLTWIQNDHNVGFSKANNQAIKIAQGKFILLLNPDTLVNEDTLDQCFSIIPKLTKLGALGVKMLDGSGQFLPESKRGLPTPFVAFCRFTGLSKIFKKSRILNRYYLGFLSKDGLHEIDVLCGAFMLIPKRILQEVGLLDETFFMYGEDIDLSYRIQKAGYKIYYYGEPSIIHYKGESTKKESFDYVKKFNQAMVIFAEKHFSSQKAWWYKVILNFSIYFRALFSLISSLAKKVLRPGIDFVLIIILLWFQKELWENLYFQDDSYYPSTYLYLNLPLYALVWTSALYIQNKPTFLHQLKNIGIATLILLSIYALLPLDYRPSRFLIVVGAVSIVIYQQIKLWLRNKIFNNSTYLRPKILIFGKVQSVDQILQKLEFSRIDFEYVGYIDDKRAKELNWIGFPEDLIYKVKEYQVDEIIFSSQDISFQEITQWMAKLGKDISYRIAGDSASGIIGSISKNTSGQMYTFETQYKVQDPYIRFLKRLTDITATILLMLFSPVIIWFIHEKVRFLRNCFEVIKGTASWVSYHKDDPFIYQLPFLKSGILNPVMQFKNEQPNHKFIHKVNQLYAKEYTPRKDITLIFNSLKYLGNSIAI